jgi:hypothetical protein
MESRHASKANWKRGLLASAVLAVTLASGAASGAFISFTANGTDTDGPLSAQADFTTSAGQVFLTLTNLLGEDVIRSAGQALSDISFDLVDGTTGTVGTNSASGQFGNLSDTGGVVTYVATDAQTGHTTDTSPVRWLTSPNTSFGTTHILLEAIGGGQPSQMIIPFAANGGTYGNVNNGFDNFNSYVIGPASFTLLLTGVTESTTISNVMFSFGTGPDTLLPGVPVPTPGVPEPGSLALIALGLVGLAATSRRKRS